MIYLASKSPRRKQLMELMGYEFKTKPTNVDETKAENMKPQDAVEYLSYIKAEPLFGEISEKDIIIGSDTVVFINDEILGKPKNEDDAFLMLKKLSGKVHGVYTGVTLILKKNGNKIVKTFSCETKVEFFPLTEMQIRDYIKTKEPMDKAGAYGIQEKGALFVKKIDGDFFNVVGLPVSLINVEIDKIIREEG